ncbi:HAD family hydrolase [Pseudonocardia sp.]|uniref:HAD family hydrolase n=1 Tax=Pseudonocardia sp. TaxID=60912 RepID=UPI003D13B786
MSKLHIFDMDGTLLRGAASVELCRHLGRLDEADDVEQAWVRGEITDVQFWDRMLPLWDGMTDADVETAFLASPWIDGVADVFADIVGRGEHSVVISQSPLFFVRLLTRWGAGAAYGAGVRPGDRSSTRLLVTADDKVRISEELMARHGLGTGDCVAYGDSTSDIGLFGRLPHTVAVNATARLGRIAARAYRGDDLREAYAMGRMLLAGQEVA